MARLLVRLAPGVYSISWRLTAVCVVADSGLIAAKSVVTSTRSCTTPHSMGKCRMGELHEATVIVCYTARKLAFSMITVYSPAGTNPIVNYPYVFLCVR